MSQAEEFIKKNTKDCSNQYDFPEYFEIGLNVGISQNIKNNYGNN